jgi:DMSO/TMAO reductase YedYZ molybdopterin-dependent catalytic subunit
MRPTRRSFLKLVPLGVAISVASCWFLEQKTPTISSGTVQNASSSQSTIATGGTSDFPEAWAEHTDHPIVDSRDYLLRVDGDVSNPLQLTLEQLYAMPSVSQSSTITCVEGWSALVAWEGIPLSRLLSLAGAPNEFSHVMVESITGYVMKISQDDAASPRTIIALKAGSAPLNDEHGYPTRLVLPTRPGLEWVKQVSRITCTKS